MPTAARVGVDAAGGTITGGQQSFVRISGALWAVVDDAVASHGSSPHNAATMAEGAGFVRISGQAVCRQGDNASCGHEASGSGHVNVG